MLMVLPVKHHKLSPIKVKKAFTLSNRITINCEPKFKKVTIKPNLFPNMNTRYIDSKDVMQSNISIVNSNAFSMKSKRQFTCFQCSHIITQGKIIKKYNCYFCSLHCVDVYEANKQTNKNKEEIFEYNSTTSTFSE